MSTWASRVRHYTKLQEGPSVLRSGSLDKVNIDSKAHMMTVNCTLKVLVRRPTQSLRGLGFRDSVGLKV